jgi:general secretion pathway protein G
MVATTKSGNKRQSGFTLIELLLVLTLIAMLAGLALPIMSKSIQRGKAATLKEDLFVLRKTINDYYADHERYPETLDDLVSEGYIRAIPVDPMTESNNTWQIELATGEEGEGGIKDIKSGYTGNAPDGTSYGSW